MDWEVVLVSAIDSGGNSVVSNSIMMALPVLSTDVISTVTDMAQVITLPNVKWATQDNDQSNRRLRGTINLPSMFGVSNAEYKSAELYGSAFGTVPAANALLAFGVYNNFADTEFDVAATAIIKVRYYVELSIPLLKQLIET